MKFDNLQHYKADVTIPVYGTIADAEVYLKEDADTAIATLRGANEEKTERIVELQKQVDELKQKLEDAKATAYAESVDAGMRERRLKRALYKACANWAQAEDWLAQNPKYNWRKMRNKCRAKAEQYK